MLSRHRVSRAAIELIKRFEGCRRHAVQLPDGRWMIGHGHTLTAREGAEVSDSDAEALLVYDLIAVQHAVNENLYAPVTQNQFDALCSFAFNIGIDNFRRSQVLKRINAGAVVQAACAMELWRKADFEGERIVVDALVRRRAAEKALFLTPPGDDFAAAPSPIIRPVIDLDALDLVPLRRPVELEASVEQDRMRVRREAALEEALPPEPPREPTPQPAAPAITAAAEAVSSRLSAIFADPGVEPEPPPEPEAPREPAMVSEPEAWPEDDGLAPGGEPDVIAAGEGGEPQIDEVSDLAPASEPAPETEVEPEPAPQAELAADVRPQADFAPPITAHPDEIEAEAQAELEPEAAVDALVEPLPDAEPADTELDIPHAPAAAFEAPEAEPAPMETPFIPARPRPAPPPKEASVVWDLLLALFGLAFFGFGIFWGLSARAPAGGLVTPLMVAWPAGLAGVGFVAVAVYRLLLRLGREAERD
ncbi:glycoside hydrolase family protein [Phenylobacterium sp.]|uniref:lysozyme n=1 Tax=Phenylobacterium sp. TaxID=1871053 RepID=UPI0025E2AE70|nr:glycoside hydrolase family protein [Phenylobacterium sp.]